MSNTNLVTTGITPYTVGSVERFQLQAFRNGLPWPLQANGATVTLLVKDPDGTVTTYNPTVVGTGAYYDWTVPDDPVGDFTRAWRIVDGATVQVSRPIAFSTVESP